MGLFELPPAFAVRHIPSTTPHHLRALWWCGALVNPELKAGTLIEHSPAWTLPAVAWYLANPQAQFGLPGRRNSSNFLAMRHERTRVLGVHCRSRVEVRSVPIKSVESPRSESSAIRVAT